jgi:hypothetical protein
MEIYQVPVLEKKLRDKNSDCPCSKATQFYATGSGILRKKQILIAIAKYGPIKKAEKCFCH